MNNGKEHGIYLHITGVNILGLHTISGEMETTIVCKWYIWACISAFSSQHVLSRSQTLGDSVKSLLLIPLTES